MSPKTIKNGGGGQNNQPILKYLAYNPQTKENYLSETPCLDYIDYILTNRNDTSQMHFIFITHDILSSLPNITEKYYLDMQDIVQDKVFETLRTLSHKFGFLAPKEQDRTIFERQVYKNLYSLVPVEIPLNNSNIKLTLAYSSSRANITQMIVPQSYQDNPNLENLQVFVAQKNIKMVAKNLEVFQKELLAKLDLLLQIPAIKQAQALNESDVLEYLKSHPKLAKDLKEILDKELCDIKRERPDIVQSWKYYHDFEVLCQELKL